MVATIITLLIIAAFMLAGAVPVGEEDVTVVFHSPAFMLACVLLAALCAWCCVRRRKFLVRLDFHLVHAGVIVCLAGAAVSHLRGVSVDVRVPVGVGNTVSALPNVKPAATRPQVARGLGRWFLIERIDSSHVLFEVDRYVWDEEEGREYMEPYNFMGAPGTTPRLFYAEGRWHIAVPRGPDGEMPEPVPLDAFVQLWARALTEDEQIELPFGFAVETFEIEHYPPAFGLYDVSSDTPQRIEGYSHPEEGLDLGEHGRVEADDLKDAHGHWAQSHPVADGLELRNEGATPRMFHARMHFTQEGADDRTVDMAVNRPVSFGGWRFYLMSYDGQEGAWTVELSARRDPGRPYVIGGIWMLIVGIAVMCWRKRGKGGAR